MERPCGHCTEDVRENWLCLTCHEVYCSRYVAEHMLFHGIEKNHLMTVSFCDLSVWCYGCEQYVDNEVLYPVQNMLHLEKFGVEKPKRVPVMSLA